MPTSMYNYGEFLDGLRLNRRHCLIVAPCSIAFVLDALDFPIIPQVARDPTRARAPGVS